MGVRTNMTKRLWRPVATAGFCAVTAVPAIAVGASAFDWAGTSDDEVAGLVDDNDKQ